MQHLLRPRNPGRVQAKMASQSATGKQVGMSKKTVVALCSLPMATRSTRVLTRTVSSNAKLSLVHDSVERDTLPLGDESALYADVAYSSKETCDKLERFGIADRVQRKGYRNKPLSAKDRRRNDAIAFIPTGGERPFATYKNRYGLARTRFMGLAGFFA